MIGEQLLFGLLVKTSIWAKSELMRYSTWIWILISFGCIFVWTIRLNNCLIQFVENSFVHSFWSILLLYTLYCNYKLNTCLISTYSGLHRTELLATQLVPEGFFLVFIDLLLLVLVGMMDRRWTVVVISHSVVLGHHVRNRTQLLLDRRKRTVDQVLQLLLVKLGRWQLLQLRRGLLGQAGLVMCTQPPLDRKSVV